MTDSTTIRVVVQARTTSTRLPGKVLLPVGGRPAAVLCAQRAANTNLDVWVATSTHESDEPLVTVMQKSGFPVVRGPLDDVLSRFVEATSDMRDQDIVVRLTADNMFPDGPFCMAVVDRLRRSAAGLARVEWPSSGLPYGMSAEAFSVGLLREADRHATAAFDREHVTPWMIRSTGAEVIESGWLDWDGSRHSCTIDTAADYERVAAVFSQIDDAEGVDWRVLCERLRDEDARHERAKLAVTDSPIGPISELCLGTAQMGMDYGITNTRGMLTDEDAVSLIETALGMGVRLIDTARAYGEAEARVGRAMRRSGSPRSMVVTKLAPFPSSTDEASLREAVDQSVRESRTQLGLDSLDCLMFHRWSQRHVPAVASRVEEMMNSGEIARLGASVGTRVELEEVLGDDTVTVVQLPVNLLDWRWRATGLDDALAARPDMLVVARSVLLQGLLVGPAELWPSIEGLDARKWSDRIDAAARRLGRTRLSMCLAYVRGLSWVHTLALGFDTEHHLSEVVDLFAEPPLTGDERRFIEDALSGAPETLLDPSNWS